MPLSEEELRLLEQMERALVEEDPKFASTLRGTSLRRSARRRAVLAGVIFLLGIVVLMVGVIVKPVIGVVGFVIMLGSATVALTAIRGQQTAAAGEPGRAAHGLTVLDGGRSSRSRRGRASSRAPRTPRSSGTFLERMEERWRRRKDQGGGF